LFHPVYIFILLSTGGVFICPDVGGSRFIWNVGTVLPNYAATHSRRWQFSLSVPRERHIALELVVPLFFHIYAASQIISERTNGRRLGLYEINIFFQILSLRAVLIYRPSFYPFFCIG
jgi:hypothetical protein